MNNGDPAATAEVVGSRLEEAAAKGEVLEIIVVARGRVRPVQNRDGQWRIRGRDDRVLTFRADSVLAVTPVRGHEP